jgi:hypothetical protein
MTAPETSPSTVVELPRKPGKPRGYPKPPNSGRKPGVRNRRSLEVEALFRPLVPATKRRLRAIIDDPQSDPEVVIRAAQLLLGYVFGRPTERREVSGPDGRPFESNMKIEDARDIVLRGLAYRIENPSDAPAEPLQPRNGLSDPVREQERRRAFAERCIEEARKEEAAKAGGGS